jgi:hypothetical protein
LPNSSPNNYVLIFKGGYHSLGPVSTLTKRKDFFSENEFIFKFEI